MFISNRFLSMVSASKGGNCDVEIGGNYFSGLVDFTFYLFYILELVIDSSASILTAIL